MRCVVFVLGMSLLAAAAVADQFAWISQETAEKAAALLEPGMELRHFCAPCGDDTWTPQRVNEVEVAPTGTGDYVEVQVNGSGIDLAYVYIPENGGYTNLAMAVGLEPSDVPPTLSDTTQDFGDTWFAGTVGEKRVYLLMARRGKSLEGLYHYAHVGTDIALSGEIEHSGEFTVSEYVEEKKTGLFVGTYKRGVGLLEGQWMTPDAARQTPFKLERFAVLMHEERTTFLGAYVSEASGEPTPGTVPEMNATLDIPVFLPAREPAPGALNKYLRSQADDYMAEVARGYAKTASEFAADPLLEVPMSMNYGARYSLGGIYAYTPGLVSLAIDEYQYTGGVHGMYWTEGVNLRVDGESLEAIGLADCLNGDYMPRLSELLIADLKRQQAQWVVDGELKAFEKKDLASFAVSRAGMTFFFAPYAVGPYAQGSFEVTVPWDKLEGFVNADTLAPLLP